MSNAARHAANTRFTIPVRNVFRKKEEEEEQEEEEEIGVN